MSLLRNDPFRDLFTLQDQLLRAIEPGYRRAPEPSYTSAWTPAVDVFEDKEAIVLKLDLPEVNSKDVEIQVEGNTLTVRGERKLERSEERENYHRIERVFGAFSRTFTLPTTVSADQIQAESKDGVLRIVLPKKAETKARTIPVQSSASPLPKQ